MHILSATSAEIQQEGEIIDLKQSKGDIVFASFADSELAALASASDRAGFDDMRLANLANLSHNCSTDLWLEKTAKHAKIIVIRLLGSSVYWQYGFNQICALAANKNIKLAFLSGDANFDAILFEHSNISLDNYKYLQQLFITGGAQNMDLALKAFSALAANKNIKRDEIKPFARFGFWLPKEGVIEFEQLKTLSKNANNFAPILFYRAALEGAGTATLELLIEELKKADITPIPIIISTLKEGACIRFVNQALKNFPPEIILNLTGFALNIDGIDPKQNPFSNIDAPIIQLLQSSSSKEIWQESKQGLSAKDLAMQITLPEMDGRIGCLIVGHKEKDFWHKRTQVQLSLYAPNEQGIGQVIEFCKNYIVLRKTAENKRKICMVLANYPIRDGRIANGVGYDVPQSSVEILLALEDAGYYLGGGGFSLAPTLPVGIPPREGEGKPNYNDASLSPSSLRGGARGGGKSGKSFPKNGNQLIELLQKGPTNANPKRGTSSAILSLKTYQNLFEKLPKEIQGAVNKRWGEAKSDIFMRQDGFHLPVLIFGNVAILLQPSRGYDLDIKANYHDPDLVPPHIYIACYLWIKHIFNANALIHNGKHGNLEWLPGKATGLDVSSYPLALWGAVPHFYPFIVNDPGEGTQAKRRTGAVIIDHLVPPLTRAETYGPLKHLEALLDEYYQAQGLDFRRIELLKKRILDFTKDNNLDKDLALPQDEEKALGEIDNYLCELKEAQIRDGLHIFGQSPKGDLERDLIIALARAPRGENLKDASLIRALSNDLKLGFDPLNVKLGEEWQGPKPQILEVLCKDIWRTNGDTIERIELLASKLISGQKLPKDFLQTKAVLKTIEELIRPSLSACGKNEMQALIDGLDGKFIAPGSSGAPTRGRLDVLPTGRNFYSIDNRSVPTNAAWELGQKSAENLLHRHFHDEGTHLKSIALSVWGTANMRTGGDDIAQALALIGVRPKWDSSSLRVSGFEIIPLAKLGRPRCDVTLRISGFFRDAFPQLINLFDRAIRAIGALDEPIEQNPIAAIMRQEALELMADKMSKSEAALKAGHRIFGAKPGAYGAGLQGLIDSGEWESKSDLATAFVNFSQYAYGNKAQGLPEKANLKKRLNNIEAVVHNQDNREHDLLDSDDYYQFEGGLIASVEAQKGVKPLAYHNDHSRPERPIIKTLEEEISFVMRSRVTNPKWIAGVMRHGYKGAFEIVASVDYMFAFAATTGAVKTHHFDLAFEAFIMDENVRDFIKENNKHAYEELKAKCNEAIERGFWQPKSNSIYEYL